jgi:AraC family transcriptional regulator
MNDIEMINNDYKSRINKVVDYIENNLGSSLSLDDMASVSNFSSYHFHRIFQSIIGESPVQYQRRKRLEKSAKDLYNSDTSIKELSSKYGFTSPAVYSRDFKKYFGDSPKVKRKKLLSRFKNLEKNNVEVKTITSFKYAYKEIVGYDQIVPEYFKLRKLLLKNKVKVGIMVEYIYDNQYITPKEKCRYDIGYIVPGIESNLYKIKESIKKEYAIFKLKGSTKKIDIAFDMIYSWIIKNDYEPENLPLLILFNKIFSLKPLLPIDYTDAEICVPIKKQELHSI